MSFLGSKRILRVTLEMPRYGGAWAKIATEAGAVAVGPATLTVGDLALVGAVVDGQAGEDGPSAWVGIWRSGTAWDTVLPARPAYQNDAGVKLSTVLAQLAKDCGAVIVQPTDRTLGAFWTRPTRSASGKPRTGADELAALIKGRFLEPWWVDALGVTRFGTRTGVAVTAAARVLDRDRTRGTREIGTESPAAFAPGGTFEGATIAHLTVREHSAKITVETRVS